MTAADPNITLTILVIDDDPKILSAVGDFLEAQGHRVHLAATGDEGLDLARTEAIDIAITDIRMPGVDGFEVLREIRRISPEIEAIVITGHKDLEHAFRAMREGAFDFFTKPFSVQDLDASLQRTARFQALHRQQSRAQERLDRIDVQERQQYGLDAIVGNSTAVREVKAAIRQVCESDLTTVLVHGETGTGKELVARAIHAGSRLGGPFVAVDCSAVPEPLFESLLYGHVKGAFTDAREDRKGHFELAAGGTLFLDEVGDLPLSVQTKLLRTLEERRVRAVGASREVAVDVRVVVATNRDLSAEVAEGRFRQDLLFRLNVFAIRVPPLRERPDDIPSIAGHFLARYASEVRRPVTGIAPGAVDLLQAYGFPGNVRELRNLVERAVIVCGGDCIGSGDLAIGLPGSEEPVPSLSRGGLSPQDGTGTPLSAASDLDLAELERQAVGEALRRTDGNKARAADLLGISRQSLLRRMKSHGM